MTSFVVSSADKKRREVYISHLVRELSIDPLDVMLIGKESSKNTSSIGIEEIKNLHAKIFLKPIRSEKKAVLLNDAELLTIEAQNALLKVLEEPPDQTIIILSTDNIEILLPTILSRCQIIELQSKITNLQNSDKQEFEEFINNLPEMKVGGRLKKAEELAKDKDGAINWIAKLILVLREKMLEETNSMHTLTIRSFQQLHTLLKTTNVNPRFAIENTLLSI